MNAEIHCITNKGKTTKNEKKYDVYVYAHNPFNKVIKF